MSVADGKYHMSGKSFSREELFENIRSTTKKRKRLLWTMWHEVAMELTSDATNSSPTDSIRKLFVSSLHDLYTLSCCFDELDKCNVVKAIKVSLDKDIESFSSISMSNVIDYALSIEWLNHLIRRDLYTIALITKLSESLQTEATGVAGPWSRTDVPMQERVFKWDQVAGETAGRAMDRRNQRRYRQGFEGYKDLWPNEGTYWREIRNEPYKFDDKDSNPYPHRNTLWSS